MKVLFADIDGVVNTTGAELGFRYCLNFDPRDERGRKKKHELFDPACLFYLKEIIDETQCKIVISSSWRVPNLEEMKSWFACETIKNAIIDWTPDFNYKEFEHLRDRRGRIQRGDEIKYWLDKHPEVTTFAVIDDDADMDAVWGSFFRTNTYDGLKRETAYKVIHHLNRTGEGLTYRTDIQMTKFLSELRSIYGDITGYKESETLILNTIRDLDNKYKRREEIKYGTARED